MRRFFGWGGVPTSPCFPGSALQSRNSRRLHRLETLEARELLSADCSVAITAPASVRGGDTLAYDITVTNHGPDGVQDVLLTDVLPTEVTFVEVHNLTPTVPLQIAKPPVTQHGW